MSSNTKQIAKDKKFSDSQHSKNNSLLHMISKTSSSKNDENHETCLALTDHDHRGKHVMVFSEYQVY